MVERHSHTTEFRDQTASLSLELDAFGAPKWNLPHSPETQGYLPYQEALETIRKHYALDPENPTTPLAQDLRLALLARLNPSQTGNLAVHFYSAIGTQLDHHHGIDAFLDIVKDGHLVKTITLDATLNPQKQTTGHKADVIVGDLSALRSEEWWRMIDRILTQMSL